MAHRDKEIDGDQINHLLEQAYKHLRAHELREAEGVLERALSVDFEDARIVASLKYVNFWSERERTLNDIANPFERGEYLLGQWPVFDRFVQRAGSSCEPCLHAVRVHVFGLALEEFERLRRESDAPDAELLARIGRCHKGLGSYDQALSFLQAAAAKRSDDAEALAELADCYALVNEVQAAKAFFREAFLVDPQRVKIDMLESQMIRRLVEKVKEHGLEGPQLLEWLPVYGVIYGVLTVKRELRAIEYGKLKQSIYALERERAEGRDKDGLIEPRLINRYFWLIDHYVNTKDSTGNVDEVLLKLRSVSERIYREYTN
jgi:tetratricopeptide (TPR) repeat protein